jgi:hypothetical protein
MDPSDHFENAVAPVEPRHPSLKLHQVDPELNRFYRRPDQVHDPLYVICPVINSRRFRTRWKLFQDFEKHVHEAGAILYVVEIAFGDRDFSVTSPQNPHHLQLRSFHELWLKERAINLCVQRLPQDWKYVAWIDGDCMFARQDWANETLHLLQHYPIIQMWSQLVDLTSDYEMHAQLRSFMSVQIDGVTPGNGGGDYGKAMQIGAGQKFGSPGLAWACRRECWNQMGGLIDYCILGAGDWYFANAIWGSLDQAIAQRNDLTGPFSQKMLDYQEHARRGRWEERSIVGNVGLMKGLVTHYWHGPRQNRGYNTRGEILARAKYDPDRDLKADWQGVYQLTDRNPRLRRDIQQYFSQRNEDQLSN